MKLLQFIWENEVHPGAIHGDGVVDLYDGEKGLTRVSDYLALGKEGLEEAVAEMAGRRSPLYLEDIADRLALPIDVGEVWGCGVTYRRSADFRQEELAKEGDIYARVYLAERPELFFKATPSRTVPSGGDIGIRDDSSFTVPEPELAVIVDRRGSILGYTVADDVSAWDIERANALYLPQSKIFAGCCSLGPVLVPAWSLKDPASLRVSCTITRGGRKVFEGETNTSEMKRTIDELIAALRRCNPLPEVTALMTGTGIIVPHEKALEDGDRVSITIEGIGTLVNTARRIPVEV